jgi:hypothetical protein
MTKIWTVFVTDLLTTAASAFAFTHFCTQNFVRKNFYHGGRTEKESGNDQTSEKGCHNGMYGQGATGNSAFWQFSRGGN